MRVRHLTTTAINLHFRFCTLAAIFMLASAPSYATPLLRCMVSYAGSTHIIESGTTQKPYEVTSVDIDGRFRFKAVMVGAGDRVDYIKLYAYFQTRHNKLPIHQATYLPPFNPSAAPVKLTPLNSLYAGDVERELQYQCSLQGVAQ